MKWLESLAPEARSHAATILAWHQQEIMRRYVHRRVVPRLDAQRPLCLAPHADDLVIGCGGALLRWSDAGVKARSIYLTDGRAAAADDAQADEMVRTRVAETRAVADALGWDEPLQLGWDERTFTEEDQREALVDALSMAWREWRPDVVLVPYWFEQHPHHRYAHCLLADVLARENVPVRVIQYEVWSFLFGNRVLDLSGLLARKLDLVRLYPSQLALFDYLALTQDAACRHASEVGPGATAGEVYLELPSTDYLAAVEAMDLAGASRGGPEVLLTPLES